MPEAPDLYVVREYLERRLTGQTVTKAEALRPIVLRCLAVPLERFAEDIAGRALTGFWRRGKFLGADLSGGHTTAAHGRWWSTPCSVAHCNTAPPPSGCRRARTCP